MAPNKNRKMSRAKSVEASLVEAPKAVVDELIQILGNYGFVLDPAASKPNPSKTWFGNRVHIQVINPDSYVEYDEIQNWVPGEMLEDIDELSHRSNCPITWNFGANINDQVTGGLDVSEQWVPDEPVEDEVLSADYGGAFDIDPKQYFTRDDVIELSDVICDYLYDIYSKEFKISDVYMDTPTRLYVAVTDEEGYDVSTFINIDMRKIRRPSDLADKYGKLAADQLRASYDEMLLDYVSSAEGDRPDWWYEPDESEDVLEPFNETAVIRINKLIVSVDDDGQWNMLTDEMDPELDVYTSNEHVGVDILSVEDISDALENAVYNILPDNPGEYELSGELCIECRVSGVTREKYEPEGPPYSSEYVETDIQYEYIKDPHWTEIA